MCSNFGTLDCSRGCPFNCSFCTVITVQGRRSRYRSPECIAETLRRNYLESGATFCFFTDDNFARNPVWEQIFDRLIQLREQEGVPFEFMIQADVGASKIPGFVEKAARAGCTSVFIGVESLNARNLQDAAKTQNKVGEYKDLLDIWRQARVSTHVSYMIGFPFDTEESVREDIERLVRELRPDKASFFMMTPIPGSRAHKAMVDAGHFLDADYNTYDSFHECMPHPRMKHGAWTRAFYQAWHRYYNFDNMRDILSRAHSGNYWALFRNCYWSRNSLLNEGAHPMVAGFFPLKDRRTRRPCFQREGRLAHWRRRVPEICPVCAECFPHRPGDGGTLARNQRRPGRPPPGDAARCEGLLGRAARSPPGLRLSHRFCHWPRLKNRLGYVRSSCPSCENGNSGFGTRVGSKNMKLGFRYIWFKLALAMGSALGLLLLGSPSLPTTRFRRASSSGNCARRPGVR